MSFTEIDIKSWDRKYYYEKEKNITCMNPDEYM